MKKFKETNELLYERSSEQKLALDVALLDEKNGDMCSIPIDKLKSKVMRDRHKKLCKTTTKKSKKSMWSKKAHRAASSGGHKLHNSVEEGTDDNLVVLIRDITSKMIGAIKKGDQRKLLGLYKNLGKVIK
tara:strand:- start:42 stop:431 length:390 start_codon:yes stop_codon:yes gene_type:complete